jgi:hypothetical protein
MKYILLIFTLFFSACSIKNYEQSSPKIIMIKSPQIKFSDLGYIRNSGDAIELELFVAGKVVEKISINHLICVSDGCMSKSGFNKDYLHPSYPENTLQNILLGKEIYDGENKLITKDGFEQTIENENVKIIYKVNSKESYFKDSKNKIIFKIKDTK